MNALTVAQLTFLEARRRKLFWIILAVGLLSLALFALGFYFIDRELRTSTETMIQTTIRSTMLLVGLYGVNTLGVTLGVLISVDTISGEIASGTIQTIATKPLRRWEIVVGKWLGLATMLAVFVLGMAGGMIVSVWAISGYFPNRPLEGMGLMILEGWVFLSLSLLGGTYLPPLGNGVVVLMLYGLDFVAGWIGQIGEWLSNTTAAVIGTVVRFLLPGEAMWQRATHVLAPSSLSGLTPFTIGDDPGVGMVVYALLYVTAVLGATVYLFGRRDL
ncbi:MAG: ABC transporter permease [Chloroflexia bacterium]